MEDKMEISALNQDSNTETVEANECAQNTEVAEACESAQDAEVVEVGEPAQSEEMLAFAEIKKLIDDHFNSIKGLVRYSKEKDANVLTLSKQMEVYRDGVEASLLKRVALEIIEYRESCRKSLRGAKDSVLSAQEAKKYIGYLQLDFEDVLENLAIKCSDDAVLYNRKNIELELDKPSFSDVPALEEVTLPDSEIVDLNSLTEYLKNCEVSLSQMVKNNTILDSLIKDYIAIASVYEQGLHQVVLYPVVRQIAKFYRALSQRIDTLAIDECNASETYREQLSLVIEEVEKILELCNVQIDGYVSDTYDPKKHRILKMIDTEETEKNGQVACRYTDCYTMEDKVIYLSKIDVYKTKN